VVSTTASARSASACRELISFWAGQKKQLSAIPANVRLKPVTSPVEGVECFDLQADGAGGPLAAYLARPKGARPKALPGIVLKDYFWKGRDSRDAIFFRGLYLRLQRAIDVVAAQPEWDGRRLVACGRSQGGGQALVAGGLDPRVTFIAAEIHAFCDHTGIIRGRINGWPRLIPKDAVTPDPRAVQAVRYYDAVNFAARTRAQAFVTVGFIDIICPPTGVYAAFNQLPQPKHIWNHLDTGHISRADYDAGVRDAVLAYLSQSAP
jgi:cephalosporin-C deacetylase-like acetyl esterase